eukprot:gnl/TRDRNA2_/TRDRNA2_173990_c3_seq7.p1 gnl/TRDRNA2_/TRDRNA2_173990_c3~~gnl/TRDRNA2_/TRDRNA2_173990_c3_seq7.p1  ORF type:complete len:354 (+),score=108.99 gnl/TRDRNA2_/TRDRNA2_173990_c3_seq7:64-1125(+)
MRRIALTFFCVLAVAGAELDEKKHHKKHHHKHHKNATNSSKPSDTAAPEVTISSAAGMTPPVAAAQHATNTTAAAVTESTIMAKMKALEGELAQKEMKQETSKTIYRGKMQRGKIEVNGPLPADFDERFAQAVAQATGCDPADVKVVETEPLSFLQVNKKSEKAGTKDDGVVEVVFEAAPDVVKSVEDQAADPDSKLANGPLHSFLVADGSIDAQSMAIDTHAGSVAVNHEDATPVSDSGIDVDTEMPYGELEPFGREDTAQELTESSVRESDEMVDQLERAEVAEEKRAVFRALTRLRGAAITSFDGIARSQTGNIDEYNKIHKWRKTHPLHHLADEESDITKWAFPDNADF